ncbi:MAG TPA: hypothetical protein VLG76_00945 [Rhabdochlamydiaceae bacterium]|nr:hypothetical protein [Rhabdochlamydiaceae bacterium]
MNKKFFITLLSCLLAFSSSPALFATNQTIDDVVEEMNDLHRPSPCTEDSAFTAVSTSMFGWGLGLAVGIALLTGLLHQSTSSAH